MTPRFRRLWVSTRASSAAEFALTLPLLLIFVFGIIDAGRFAWEFNQAEKATQVGARFAVVTDPVAPGLAAYKFTASGLNAGDTIPAAALSTITCDSTNCSCSGTCPTGIGAPVGAWTQLVTRMRQIDPSIQETNIRVLYAGSGVGFAGDPTGMDIVPNVTVQLSGMTFRPLLLLAMRTVTMPDFHTSLTGEDNVGTQSN